MKFSILLPTRNRLEYLKYAVNSVLVQDYDNWEIIISDNFSEQDIKGYVESLSDLRLKYFRTEDFISVTDNWNNALKYSTGDYILMLGDDDCLMRGYFKEINKLLEKFPSPDFIYTSGFIFGYPGVISNFPNGFLRMWGNASFLESKSDSFWLSREDALHLVKHSMNFKVMFTYNMQYALINRTLIDKLRGKGPFFQSLYPDYYAMTAMMLNAERILACPKPLVTVGISPKSFGYYFFNQQEQKGVNFLNRGFLQNEQRLANILLPGIDMNNSWLSAMETVKNNYKDEFDLKVNYKRYRLLQIVQIYKRYAERQIGFIKVFDFWKLFTTKEKLIGFCFHFVAFFVGFVPTLFRDKILRCLLLLFGSHPRFMSKKIKCPFVNIQQVYENVDVSNCERINSYCNKA